MSEIEKARKIANLKRREVSELLEIPYRTLQNWEIGERECPKWAEKLIIEKIERIKEDERERATRMTKSNIES